MGSPMKHRPLFTEVLLLNAALVTLASIAAALVAGFDSSNANLVVPLVIAATLVTLVLNVTLLRRRFAPLEAVIDEMEKVDLSRPGANLPAWIDGRAETEEAQRLELAFLRMMRRLEAERRRSSSAALRAQEQERARVARDLHDEVNQSLTGVLLRLEAARAAQRGASREEVCEAALRVAGCVRLLFTVDTLEFLERNGRIGKAASLLGTLLSIKPIIHLEDGEVAPRDKVLGARRLLPRVVELMNEAIGSRAIRAAVLHTDAHEKAEEWRCEVEKAFKCSELIVNEVGPVVGTHAGPGAVGVAWHLCMS